MYVLTLLLALFVLQTNSQSECGDYTVSVSQNGFLEGQNVKLSCTYTSTPDVQTIVWRTKNNTNEFSDQAYIYVNGYPEFTGPTSRFEGKLVGMVDGNTHTLTILKANSSDDLNYWTCIVSTQQCPNTNKDTLRLILTGKHHSVWSNTRYLYFVSVSLK